MKFILFAINLALVMSVTPTAFAVHDYPADPYWAESDEANLDQIDHSMWQRVLNETLVAGHVSGVNRVDYAALRDNPENLDAYLAAMSSLPIRRYSRSKQFAYWVNVYNALTLKVVSENYPVDSIREVHGGWFNTGPWDEELFSVEGKTLTLNDIEHRILRPIWRDPRIHFVVNCASIGCPNLGPVALTGENSESILEQAGHEFLTHPRGASLDGESATLSKIFRWYRSDFGETQAEVLATLSSYLLDPVLAERLNSIQRVSYEYDWDLNRIE